MQAPKDDPHHASETSDEVKQGFTWSYLGLTAVVSLMTGVIGFVASYGVEALKRETRQVNVAISTSSNLATIPQSVVNNLEVYLDVAAGQKEPVRSLYKYDVTISDNSPFGMDDFTISFEVPKALSLSADPIIASNPPALLRQIAVTRIDHAEQKDSYKVSLLNPRQALTFSYFGYAKGVVGPQPMSVVVLKKDWIQNNVQSPDEEKQSYFAKKITDLTVKDFLITHKPQPISGADRA